MTSEPVVVLYKAADCGHCQTLSKIWDTPTPSGHSVKSAMQKVHPKVRFFVVSTSSMRTGQFDTNTAPRDIIRYKDWFPMILLIPGKLWDEAMSKLGPKNDVELVQGVQVMNGIVKNGKLSYNQKYDIRKPDAFAAWLKEAMDLDDFKKASASSKMTQISTGGLPVPISETPKNAPSAPPAEIIKPSQPARLDYVSTRYTAMEPGDVCGMRIIPRTKN